MNKTNQSNEYNADLFENTQQFIKHNFLSRLKITG